MNWISKFDPAGISADLNASDRQQRHRKRIRNAHSQSALTEKTFYHPSFDRHAPRSVPDTNGGPSMCPCSESKPTALNSIASIDFSSMTQQEARDAFVILQPLYRRVASQPDYIRDPELKDCLKILQCQAEGQRPEKAYQRYQLKNLGYSLATFLQNETPPSDLILDALANVLMQIGQKLPQQGAMK